MVKIYVRDHKPDLSVYFHVRARGSLPAVGSYEIHSEIGDYFWSHGAIRPASKLLNYFSIISTTLIKHVEVSLLSNI